MFFILAAQRCIQGEAGGELKGGAAAEVASSNGRESRSELASRSIGESGVGAGLLVGESGQDAGGVGSVGCAAGDVGRGRAGLALADQRDKSESGRPRCVPHDEVGILGTGGAEGNR